MRIVFWYSFLMLFYTYAGYPLLVWLLARFFGSQPPRRDFTPFVSFLIPAYNEQAHLEAKLNNVLALDYPKDRLEIIVASDGSTDETNAIAARFAPHGVQLVAMRDNLGKAALLDRVVPGLRGELIVFSDASSELEVQALRQLVKSFADWRVGCVSGAYRLKAASSGEGLYWRYEQFIKRQESRLHSIMGAHGALYAIRKFLFRPLGASAINDDYLIPMRVIELGFRAVQDPAAVCWEREVVSTQGEFARRCRIAAGNCQQIAALRRLLNPLRGWVALCFLSHKVLRTVAPFLMLALLVSSFWLPKPIGLIFLGLQAALYLSAVAGYLCQRRGLAVKWLSPSFYFCLGNLAMLVGVLQYCVVRKKPAWGSPR